jgi:NAD(P)-dependent dehydrogenase (short-subunit alcohol dehydrogenase family)
MKRLEGKRALITGATSGIGLETARLFLEEGARVAITGRSAADLDRARGELGADVVTLEADAADVGRQSFVAAGVRDAFGALDTELVHEFAGHPLPVRCFEHAACRSADLSGIVERGYQAQRMPVGGDCLRHALLVGSCRINKFYWVYPVLGLPHLLRRRRGRRPDRNWALP